MEEWIFIQGLGHFSLFVRDPLGNHLTQSGFSKTDQMAILLRMSGLSCNFGADVATENWAPLVCVITLAHSYLWAHTFKGPLNRKRSASLALSGQCLLRFGPLFTKASVDRLLSEQHIVPSPENVFRQIFGIARGTPDDLSAETAHRVTTTDSGTYIGCVIAGMQLQFVKHQQWVWDLIPGIRGGSCCCLVVWWFDSWRNELMLRNTGCVTHQRSSPSPSNNSWTRMNFSEWDCHVRMSLTASLNCILLLRPHLFRLREFHRHPYSWSAGFVDE